MSIVTTNIVSVRSLEDVNIRPAPNNRVAVWNETFSLFIPTHLVQEFCSRLTLAASMTNERER